MFDLHILLVPGLKVGLMADQMEDGKKNRLRSKAWPRFDSLMLPRYCPEVRSTKFKPAHRRTWLPCSNRRKSPPKAMMAGLSGREMPMGRT